MPAFGGCGWFGGNDDEPEPTATQPAAQSTGTTRPARTPTARPASPTPRATNTPAATPTAQRSEAQGYLDDIEAQWAETDTVHFTLDIEGETFLDANEQIEFRGAEGDLARPDSAAATATIYGGFIPFDVEIISIGEDSYVTNFITGDWERAPDGFDFNPAILFSADEGLGAVAADLEDPELVGEETINGREARQIHGITSEDAIDKLVAGQLEGDEIELDLWMDAETDEVLRLRIAEPATAADPIAWVLDFSDFNEPVEIEAPDL